MMISRDSIKLIKVSGKYLPGGRDEEESFI
jgi:hypothetical protein